MRRVRIFASPLALGVLLSIGTSARRAHAGNADSFYYSDDAAMTAGAVVATTRDAGAIYYNPAGLGGLTRNELDLNGTVLILRIRPVNDALTLQTPGVKKSTDLHSSDFLSVPQTLAFVRNLSPSVSAGVALYVTERDTRTAESQIEFDGVSPTVAGVPGTAAHYQQRIDLLTDSTAYRVGPSVGWQVRPNLRVGASLFGAYAKSQGVTEYLVDAKSAGTNPSTVEFEGVQARTLISYLGAQAVLGAQWEPAPSWHVGLAVRSPTIVISSSADGASLGELGEVATGAPSSSSVQLVSPQAPFSGGTLITPTRVTLGVAHDLAPRTWASAEVDYQSALTTTGIESSTNLNARVGVRYQMSPKLGLGAGLFTDRAGSSYVGPVLGDESIDSYGATLGAELRTPLSLSDRPAPDALVLSTTIALRYAIGFGDVRAVDIDLTSASGLPPRTVSVVYHEIIPYIGTGVFF